jgi:cyclopropane fatty-acyl-phospholipid synthase-like methyltransferase
VTETGYDPAAHYDRVTDAWRLLLGDELHYGVFDRGDEPLPDATAALTARMIAAAQLSPGLDVLDVGCGSGAPACRLAAEYGVRVVGITTSAAGVAAARDRAAAARLSSVATFEQRDGTDNGLPDASFDRVWVLESSHLMRERERLVAECARVLRPGGRLVLCDLVRHREIPFQEVRDRRADFVTLRAAFGDAHFEPLEFYTAAAQRQRLVVDVVSDLTAETLPTFDRWRANASAHGGSVATALGADGLRAFERSCDILEGFWRDGTFGYGLFAAAKPER